MINVFIYVIVSQFLFGTVEPLFNASLYNKVVGITNDFLQPGQNYSKMYGTEPWFNKPRFNGTLVITNTRRKCKHTKMLLQQFLRSGNAGFCKLN